MTLDNDLDQHLYSARFDVKKLITTYEKLCVDSLQSNSIKTSGIIQNGETKNMGNAKGENLTEYGPSKIENSDSIERNGEYKEELDISREKSRELEEISDDTQAVKSIGDLIVVDNRSNRYEKETCVNCETAHNSNESSTKDLHETNSSIFSSPASKKDLDANSNDRCDNKHLNSTSPSNTKDLRDTDSTKDLEVESNKLCDSDQVISSNLNSQDASEIDSKGACEIIPLNSSSPIIENESEVDSEEPCFVPPPVLAIRPAFKPRGRMFKSAAPQAAPAQFIMDVPEMWGVGADGSIMEAFNKLEINK